MAQSPYIADVSQADFAVRVIEQSRERPVLVDFWAPWCGPCRALAPILERLVDEYAGKLFLAKVNTDVEQELALRYHIRGIPAVKLFRDGEIAAEFVGVQPEPAIRALIERFVPNEADEMAAQAAALAGAGDTAGAEALLRQALAKEPQSDRLKLALAELLLGLGQAERVDESAKLLESLSIRAAGNPEVERLRFRLRLQRIVQDAAPRAALEQKVAANPEDLRARYELAAHLALAQDYEPAMEQLLEIVRRDRKFEDDAGRKALVGLFHLLGQSHPLVVKYRGLLSRTLS